MARPRSSLPKALRLVESVVAERAGSGSNALPGARTLARLASVSEATMLKALRALADRGVLKRAERKRYLVAVPYVHAAAPQTATPTVAAPEPEPRWRRVAARLRADLLAGLLTTTGRLPARKELMARYGVCHQTLAKAICELCACGELREERTSLVVPPFAGSGARTKVLLLARGYQTAAVGRRITVYDSRTQEWLRLTEAACSRVGLRLEVYPCSFETATDVAVSGCSVTEFAEAAAADHAVLGYLAWSHGMPGAMMSQVLPPLASHGRPIAVFDGPDTAAVPRIPGFERIVCSFAPGPSQRCAYDVGRYLYSLGHRAIAYVSLEHSTEWSRGRLEGLREAVAGPGLGGSVAEATVSIERRQVYNLGLDGVQQMLDSLSISGPPPFRPYHDDLLGALRTNAHAIYPAIAREEDRRTLVPRLRTLMAQHAPTAIVGANDEAALICLRRLRDTNVAVPGDVSVVGFDDAGEATLAGLTSYSLNAPAIINAMVAHLVKPDYRPRGRVTVEGFIAHRDSVAGPGARVAQGR